jgi:DNA topoisomerase-2
MEETHVILSDVAHCLQRPDTLIGSVSPQETSYLSFVKDNDEYAVSPTSCTVPPALAQIFLEIATNATDHAARTGTHVRNIRVAMNDATGEISIENDGHGIPIRKHTQKTDLYLPTVIFSEFRCGQNFDDSEARTVAGRNGYGAKCTNAWSTLFRVETQDGNHSFCQEWSNNMDHASEAVVKACKKKSFTRITFIPDYARLHVTDIPAALAYLRTFVWHLCVVTAPDVHVFLDGEKLPVRNLKDYSKMFMQEGTLLYEEGTNLQVALGTPRADLEPTVIGFVNGIPCSAGTHVNFVLNRLRDLVPTITVPLLRGNATVLVNVTVVNPTFTSQTKEQLSLDMRKSGAAWEPSAAFIRNFKKSAVVDTITQEQEMKELRKAKQTATKGTSATARYVAVDGYESATMAGDPKRTAPVSLMLTEGDSAKAFAVAGLSVTGRTKYGVFPLRGKLKNVRGEKITAIMQTVEIANILKILGVDFSRGDPQTTKDLRYDRLIILTDQDVDGAHIGGLILNALWVLLPDLMRNEPHFVQRLSTPLVRAVHGQEVHEFMTEREFDEWYGHLSSPGRYHIKYYKGLGTSTPKDAKALFSQLDKYLITIDCAKAEDVELLADFFDGKRADRRKELLMSDDASVEVDYAQSSVDLGRFLMAEMIPFSRYNNERSLAHVMDGLKPALRKILWVLLSGNKTQPTLKVAQLSGEVARKTHYKHGENSLNDAIVKMAQDFPLSGNNINLLTPEGMFGNRHGDDAASPRYIFTGAEPIALALFPKDDYAVYTLLQQEGFTIEPEFMVPILPLVLINGTTGIGTGFSSEVPPHNPVDVLQWARRYINHVRNPTDVPLPNFDAKPFLEGLTDALFTGSGWNGQIVRESEKEIHITDLPIATNAFKAFPKALAEKIGIHHWTVQNTDTAVDLYLTTEEPLSDAMLQKIKDRAYLPVHTTNMTLWSPEKHYPKLFSSTHDIAMAHAAERLSLNEKRRAHQIDSLQKHLLCLHNESRFVETVIAQPSYLLQQKKADVIQRLTDDGFDMIDQSYQYLLRLPADAFTEETLEKARRQKSDIQAQLDAWTAKTACDIWDDDLTTFERAYESFLIRRLDRRQGPVGEVTTRKRPAASEPKKAPRKKKAALLTPEFQYI